MNRLAEIKQFIDHETRDRHIGDEYQQRAWHVARAMMAAYADKWPQENEYSTRGVEIEFLQPIKNPATGAESRTFVLRGKVDRLLDVDGEAVLMEHKTASELGDDYQDKLFMDFQTNIYAHFLGLQIGRPINGVIYNVLCKTRIRQNLVSETEDEFTQRYVAACAATKNGKSSIKRKFAEPDETFQMRLAERFAPQSDPLKDKFHRFPLMISDDQTQELLESLWVLSKQLIDARNRNHYYPNDSMCFSRYGSKCEYLKICSTQKSNRQRVIEECYGVRKPFGELSDYISPNGDKRQTITFSALKRFRDCRRLYKFYIDGLVPRERNENMAFGTLIHKCLQIWHSPEGNM